MVEKRIIYPNRAQKESSDRSPIVPTRTYFAISPFNPEFRKVSETAALVSKFAETAAWENTVLTERLASLKRAVALLKASITLYIFTAECPL
ncbi:MAG: hypothetical protein CBC48_09365 [bacterium TMED88]|nr:hypothetical protein [Deltaproteobacteria bacterium]OUV31772.1 MAG: hypothetical protein CBC48_09365 [bacterium TMED88]